MTIIEKKDRIQKNALEAWLKNYKYGTAEMVTGSGKTFLALHCLYTMPKDNNITHLFLAEVKGRKETLMKEIIKYNIIFKRNVLKDYNLRFGCYQTACKKVGKNYGLIIGDEIHDALTPMYFKFFKNNTYLALICLSAKIKLDTKYLIDNKYISKGHMLNTIAPIIFKYGVNEAKKDKVSKDLKVHIIYNELDTLDKYIQVGNKKNKFYQTEA